VTRYPRQVREAIEEDYFGALDDDEMARLARLPRGVEDMVGVNSMEWLIAEGDLVLGDDVARRPAIELVLGPDGPKFTAEQRAFLEELSRRPLRPYEVLESRPNEGLLLHDLLVPDEPPVWVNERLGSRQLVQWDVFGGRVLPVGDDRILSGALYPVAAEDRIEVLEEIRTESYRGFRKGVEVRRAIPDDMVAGLTIIDRWLSEITAPPPEIELRDAGTRDPLMLVTDHYEVLDWSALTAALEKQPDVSGDRKQGWTRFQPIEGDRTRSLLAINIGKQPDRIEPFARTLNLADQGRSWLEQVAGGAVRHLSRDVVNPQDILKERGGPSAFAARDPAPRMSPAEATRFAQEFHERSYRTWVDQPVPALDDRTPRQAVATPEGRAKVEALLKLYESSEQRQAREAKRAPADLRFLWEQVGLDRDRLLADVLGA